MCWLRAIVELLLTFLGMIMVSCHEGGWELTPWQNFTCTYVCVNVRERGGRERKEKRRRERKGRYRREQREREMEKRKQARDSV